MKTIKQLSNKIKSVASGISTFIPTQLSFWNSGQIVTSQNMNVFSQDIYEKLALLTTNINKFPVVVFADGGISKFTINADKRSMNIPALACAFQLADDQGNNLPYKPYVIGYSNPATIDIYLNATTYVYAINNIPHVDPNPTNVPIFIGLIGLSNLSPSPEHCLLCIVNYSLPNVDKTIDFSMTNFLVNSAVSTTNSANIIDPDNAYNAITPSALNKGLTFFTNQGNVAQYDPTIIYKQYAQIWTVENDTVHDYVTHWISNVNNNVTKPTLANHGDWLLASQGYYNPNNADFRTIFEGLETNSLICEGSIRTKTDVISPYFIERNNAVHVIGKQDDPLSSGLACVYEGRGAVKIYGVISVNSDGTMIPLGIRLDDNLPYSINATPSGFFPTTFYRAELNFATNNTNFSIFQNQNFTIANWNITIHGSLYNY